MGMPVKLSDELVEQAREEARAAYRSVTAQIEYWARLGRTAESLLRHEDMIALREASAGMDATIAPPARRAIVAALRGIAADAGRSELASTLMRGRTVYQDAGDGRVERIESDGSRSVGRIVNRRFVAEATRGSSGRK